MYRHFLIGITILFMINEIHGQWEVLNELNGSPNTIDFISENTGWIAGDHVLLKTEDAGISWQSIPVGENLRLDYCDFINELSGWAIGYSSDLSNYIILKIIEGGQNWSINKEMPNHFQLILLQVLNDSTVYVIGYDRSTPNYARGFVWKSSDGGSTWNDISPNLLSKVPLNIWFTDTNTGVLICQRSIFRTSDGGVTWKENSFTPFDRVYDLQFSTDSTAFFLAEKKSNDQMEYFLCASYDTFKTWMIKTQRVTSIHPYFALDENSLFAVMKDSIGQHLMKSTDAGTNWEQICALGDYSYSKLYMKRNGLGFLFSVLSLNGGTIWSSTDNGYSWTITKFSYPLKVVFFIDKYKGYIGGGRAINALVVFFIGRLFKTDNSGETWNALSESPDGLIRDCQFINNDIGFILTQMWNGSFIYITEDGGNSWHDILSTGEDTLFKGFNINKTMFIDGSIGWAVGKFSSEDSSGASILGTADSGENWDIVFTHLDTDIEEFEFYSINIIDSTVWAVGENGLMAKYTVNDQWQLQTSVTDLPLNDVSFSDEQHGWIAGGYFNSHGSQSILLKTNDSGQIWTEIRFDKHHINDMYFADSLHGWVVGTDTSWSGMILETFDGGDTWNTKEEGLSAPLYSIHFKDGYGWAVGDNGLILRYDGLTWIEDKPITNSVPKRYELSQNYPNPFNPSTTIEFTLPRPERVTLKIYNILGEEVTTLVSAKLQAGAHKYTFDGSKFASGVYLYRLRAGEFTEIKKLVLLK